MPRTEPARAGGFTSPVRWGPRWGRPVGQILDQLVYRTRIHGRENVPADGAVIFAANHLSYLDGPVMVGAAPRRMHVLVKQEMFKGFLGKVLQYSGQIPVDRTGDRAALADAKALLSEGRCVGILPEGTRGAGDAAEVSSGVAWLALNTGAPVVPVAVLGTRISGEHRDAIPRPGRIFHVAFGAPEAYCRLPSVSGRVSMDTAAEDIRRQLAGHVRDSVALTGQPLPADHARDDNRLAYLPRRNRR
jgi:1-acyl-sn-glycerol-3-phosphate acyltransferase